MSYNINESNFERQRILAENTNRLARKYLSAFDYPKPPKILDLGCGLGYTTRELADIFLVSNLGLSKKLMTLTAEAMLPAMLADGILKEEEQHTLLQAMKQVEESGEYELLTNPIITVWAEE